MNSGYEKIKTDKQIPAMIAYLDREMLGAESILLQPAYIPPHWHRSIEMSLVMKGRVELWIHEEKQVIEAGDFIFINSGSVHQLREGKEHDTAVMMVIISYDFLKKVYPDIDHVYFKLPEKDDELDEIRRMYGEFKRYCQTPSHLIILK